MNLDAHMQIVGHNVKGDRQKDDYYATPYDCTDALLSVESFNGSIWECCCGKGHISKRLEEQGFAVESTDLVDRGYGQGGVDVLFERKVRQNIVTNPPYKLETQIQTDCSTSRPPLWLLVLLVRAKLLAKFGSLPQDSLAVASRMAQQDFR